MENCGIDVVMKSSSVCILDGRGAVGLEQSISTDEMGLGSVLSGRQRMRCVLEAGPLAEWKAKLVEQMGHEAVVIDVRKAIGLRWYLVEAAHVPLTRKNAAVAGSSNGD